MIGDGDDEEQVHHGGEYEMTNETDSKPAAGLAAILSEMLYNAGKMPGSPVRRYLSHGLRVDILVSQAGKDFLQISRPGTTFPSEQEWTTVLKNWPTAVTPDIEPERFSHSNRSYLRAALN